jgi:hypothetical protein
MPRKKTTCARKQGHLGECRTAKALTDHRDRKTERRRGQTLGTPAAQAKWRVSHKLKRYGLTQEDFDRLLETQGHACAMCFEPFEDGRQVCIDHDHTCCPRKKRSCGKCVRGLLCLACNTALGQIERKYDLAQAYLNSRPASGPPALPVAA